MLRKKIKLSWVYAGQRSLKVDSLLPEILDNIRHPYKSIKSKLLDIDQQVKEIKKVL